MFETEKCVFYKKAIFLEKAGVKFKSVVPVNLNKEYKVQFIYGKEEEIYINEYQCININKDNFREHNKNIAELYRTCGEEKGDYPIIFISVCSRCGRYYYTNEYKNSEISCMCNPCHEEEIKSIISGEECQGSISYVYLIQASESKNLKIGFSSNPDRRIKKLQTGNKEKLSMIGLIRGGAKTEKMLHKMFASYRERGEWFRNSEEIRSFFDISRNNNFETLDLRGVK